MADNPNYWKFQGTIKKLKDKENKCFICGSDKNHRESPDVNLKTFCEFFKDNFVLKIKESEVNKIDKKRKLNIDIDLNKPLKISRLTKFMKLVNKPAKKIVKISVDDKLYRIRNVRDQNDRTILEIRGYKEGFILPNYENDNFVIHIDWGDELRLSRFRKIIKLVSSKNVLKVSIKEELYNIIQIKDREDSLIFVVDFNTNLQE